jgi:hypothetical protein
MALTALSHHIDADNGIVRLTYNELCDITSLSRAKLSAGLATLAWRGLIEREPDGRGSYRLANYNPERDWAQFPAKGLYHNDTIAAFDHFRLRLPAELDALKLYFLFTSRRSRKTNLAFIGYEKIEEYSGVARNNIKRALALLSSVNLVYPEHIPSQQNEQGVANAYRLVHLDTRRHLGTTVRGADPADLRSDGARDFNTPF